jgi:hypothetical protein
MLLLRFLEAHREERGSVPEFRGQVHLMEAEVAAELVWEKQKPQGRLSTARYITQGREGVGEPLWLLPSSTSVSCHCFSLA